MAWVMSIVKTILAYFYPTFSVCFSSFRAFKYYNISSVWLHIFSRVHDLLSLTWEYWNTSVERIFSINNYFKYMFSANSSIICNLS